MTTKTFTLEDLKKAFEAGRDSKDGELDYAYGDNPYITYEYNETFEQYTKRLELTK